MAPTFVDENEIGFGWISPEPAFLRRCSHAVAVDGDVWVLDPVWDEEALERVEELGTPAGVVQQLDRHGRDCARVAERLGVPLHVVPRRPPAGSPFEVLPLLRNRFWREVALWFPGPRVLAVAEALGTAQFYRGPHERLAVSPLLRLTPPRRLLRFEPEHVLVGHGEGVHDDAAGAVREAVTRARTRAPSWLWAGLRAHGPFGTHRRR